MHWLYIDALAFITKHLWWPLSTCLYLKKTLKTFDKKPLWYHYYNILSKYNMLDFENYQLFLEACLIFKSFKWACPPPPPLMNFIHRKNKVGVDIRASTRGDCEVQRRKTKFSQMVVSIRDTKFWNTLPDHVITYENYTGFKTVLKQWLNTNHSCTHT